jgi:hypothetical protein
MPESGGLKNNVLERAAAHKCSLPDKKLFENEHFRN